jgi:SnoaL-like domain
MSTLTPAPAELSLRKAMEARDPVAVMEAFTPNAVLRSPLTEKLAFEGREQIGAITRIILDVFEDFHYTTEVRSGDTAFLVARARVDGQNIEMVDHLRLDPDGKVRELTVFFRPLPAAAVALRLLGAGLGRRKGPLRAATISALTRPLGLLIRAGDGIGVRLVRGSL